MYHKLFSFFTNKPAEMNKNVQKMSLALVFVNMAMRRRGHIYVYWDWDGYMKLTRKQNEKLALSLRSVSVSFRYQSESQTTLRLFDWWIPFSLCPFHIWRIISSETSSTFWNVSCLLMRPTWRTPDLDGLWTSNTDASTCHYWWSGLFS